MKRLRVRSYISKFTLLVESILIFFFYKILKNIYLFILLRQALVVARVTFDFHCGMQDL